MASWSFLTELKKIEHEGQGRAEEIDVKSAHRTLVGIMVKRPYVSNSLLVNDWQDMA